MPPAGDVAGKENLYPYIPKPVENTTQSFTQKRNHKNENLTTVFTFIFIQI